MTDTNDKPPQWIYDRAQEIVSRYFDQRIGTHGEKRQAIIEAMQEAGREVAFYFAGQIPPHVYADAIRDVEQDRPGVMASGFPKPGSTWTREEAGRTVIVSVEGAGVDSVSTSDGATWTKIEAEDAQEVDACLDRMDALLDPAGDMLAVGAQSVTAQGSRRDMGVIRAEIDALRARVKNMRADSAKPAGEPIRAALVELVALRDIRDEIETEHKRPGVIPNFKRLEKMAEDIVKREPAAWKSARSALAAAPAPSPETVTWWNGCDRTVPAALRFLADNERPRHGESRFNAAHLLQLAGEIERMAAMPLFAPATKPEPASAPSEGSLHMSWCPAVNGGGRCTCRMPQT